ncbi:ABC transporter ATP-binding protein [Kibdelosporangium aridum]|uniref:Iron complex transport system ATP-binding protein n=1 Tax=Kibdelosporangium aridum TaxID=2030 RepID=A0A1Y5Y8X3_KIBAR|nr:ABC transporter ATP-binding protein [Kibdelosporangium aridum]SMD27324.1 iron complex transport system ATP-binding protein [Kibdelosporangium aridum]
MKVRFDHVSVALGGREVLRDVDIEVRPGRFLGLVGPNGSGKSTLLRTLYRAVVPSSGRVLLDELDVWRGNRRAVARTVAVMTQDTSTEFDLTVLEVVLLARVPFQRGFGRDTEADLDLAWTALERVGATDIADRPIGRLSGGQRQRVMLARALAADTPVLVLDEPTNHLDIAFQLELMRIATSLDRTIIAALHDLNLAATHCDDIAVLDSGRLVATGTPAEALTPRVVQDVFQVAVDQLTHPRTGHPVLVFDHPPQSRPEPSTHRGEIHA